MREKKENCQMLRRPARHEEKRLSSKSETPFARTNKRRLRNASRSKPGVAQLRRIFTESAKTPHCGWQAARQHLMVMVLAWDSASASVSERLRLPPVAQFIKPSRC